jgi:CCR4-NOT transcriptional complex subunit CAF120
MSRKRTCHPAIELTPRYAVFPERLEVISQSNLMKVVGRVGGEMVTIEGRMRDSGWALVMPESADGNGTPPSMTPLTNMMKWVTGMFCPRSC